MRRRLAALVAVAATAAAGCGGATTGALSGEQSARADAPSVRQIANGPVSTGRTGSFRVALERWPDPVRLRFKRPPRAGLLFDLDSGKVLWRHNPTRVLPIASLTKMMTALVVVDRLPEGARVKVTDEALSYTGSGVGVLPRGKRVGVSAMLHGLMLVSGNDTAIALAQRAAGSQRRFVARMNERAREMRLACTRFASPSGIVDEGNHSCAADLAVLARAVLDEPRLARIVRRRQAVLRFPIEGGRLYLNNSNPLLRERYPGTIGIKTGFTDKAGRCLVAAVERGGRRLGVVLLHSPDPGRQAKQLFERGFRVRR